MFSKLVITKVYVHKPSPSLFSFTPYLPTLRPLPLFTSPSRPVQNSGTSHSVAAGLQTRSVLMIVQLSQHEPNRHVDQGLIKQRLKSQHKSSWHSCKIYYKQIVVKAAAINRTSYTGLLVHSDIAVVTTISHYTQLCR